MPGGYSSLGGQVINAYDASQTPSGSSAGPGVAASVGLATLTIGTETSGSILGPSAANSDVGIKPTTGLVSRTGIVPIAASQDTAGPIVKSVADAAALLTVICGKDPLDSFTAGNPLVGHDFTKDLNKNALQGARIGVVASQVPAAGTDNLTLWNAATAVLTQLGATLVPVTLDTSSSIPGGSTVLSYEFKRDLNIYLSRLPGSAPMKTLADIIAYNDAHAQVALKFGQVLALASQAKDITPGSADTVNTWPTAPRTSPTARAASTRSCPPATLPPCYSPTPAARASGRRRTTRPSPSRRATRPATAARSTSPSSARRGASRP